MASCSCWLCGWDIVETSTRTEGPTKGSIRKKTYTKPLPPNAEVVVVKGETVAKVKPPKGRAVTYPVTTGKDGLPKIVVTSATFVAKFRDGSGIIHNEKSRPAAAMKARLGRCSASWNAEASWFGREC